MSYVNDPNDPNFVVPNTVPPIAEAVEPAPNPLRWLWWLLGLLVLAGLIWALVHACRPANCTALPESVWTTTQQEATWNAVAAFDPVNLTSESRTGILTGLRALCNDRLNGTSLTANHVETALASYNVTGGVATNILNLVNGQTFCRCS